MRNHFISKIKAKLNRALTDERIEDKTYSTWSPIFKSIIGAERTNGIKSQREKSASALYENKKQDTIDRKIFASKYGFEVEKFSLDKVGTFLSLDDIEYVCDLKKSMFELRIDKRKFGENVEYTKFEALIEKLYENRDEINELIEQCDTAMANGQPFPFYREIAKHLIREDKDHCVLEMRNGKIITFNKDDSKDLGFNIKLVNSGNEVIKEYDDYPMDEDLTKIFMNDLDTLYTMYFFEHRSHEISTQYLDKNLTPEQRNNCKNEIMKLLYNSKAYSETQLAVLHRALESDIDINIIISPKLSSKAMRDILSLCSNSMTNPDEKIGALKLKDAIETFKFINLNIMPDLKYKCGFNEFMQIYDQATYKGVNDISFNDLFEGDTAAFIKLGFYKDTALNATFEEENTAVRSEVISFDFITTNPETGEKVNVKKDYMIEYNETHGLFAMSEYNQKTKEKTLVFMETPEGVQLNDEKFELYKKIYIQKLEESKKLKSTMLGAIVDELEVVDDEIRNNGAKKMDRTILIDNNERIIVHAELSNEIDEETGEYQIDYKISRQDKNGRIIDEVREDQLDTYFDVFCAKISGKVLSSDVKDYDEAYKNFKLGMHKKDIGYIILGNDESTQEKIDKIKFIKSQTVQAMIDSQKTGKSFSIYIDKNHSFELIYSKETGDCDLYLKDNQKDTLIHQAKYTKDHKFLGNINFNKILTSNDKENER